MKLLGSFSAAAVAATILVMLTAAAVTPTTAFCSSHSPQRTTIAATTTQLRASNDENASILDKLESALKIAQKSNAEGFGFKQIVADVLAGDDFDAASIEQDIETTIQNNPCVMYTWENSPSCQKALEAFEVIGCTPTIVRLDDPWETGNPIRAVLGRRVGRTSVPFVFVQGRYIGGYDGGLENNPDASGMVDMAFSGKLRKMLTEAGALSAEE